MSFNFLRRIWRELPLPTSFRGLISRIISHVLRSRLPSPVPFALIDRGPLYVAGFLQSNLGLGEAARLNIALLQQAGLPVQAVNLSQMIHQQDFPFLDATKPKPGAGGAIILHVNAPEVLSALQFLGADIYRRRAVIGYWFWELQQLPQSWHRTTRYLHEVWTATNFCADAIRRSTDHLVRTVPLMPHLEPIGPGRTAFGLSDQAFVCVTAFDMRSSLARKNPLGAVRAFEKAFGADPDAVLVLKCHNINRDHPSFRMLLQEIDGKKNVRLVDKILSRPHMHHLLQCADAVISLHRSEGYGLLLAEGMAYGAVAVATGWSGNMDFMNEGNSAPVTYDLVPVQDPQKIYQLQNAVWAEPSIDDASKQLIRLRSDPILRKKLARQGQKTIAALRSPSLHRNIYRSAFGDQFFGI